MVPDDRREQVMARLVKKIEVESDDHVGVGLIGAQWLMRTLTENGQGDLAFKIATQTTYPGWGYMISKGATTVWELWNGDTADPAMNSGNHVMQIGDLNVWFYEYLAGIRSDAQAVGFKKIVIRPYPVAGLDSVSASHESPYGRIASKWVRRGAGDSAGRRGSSEYVGDRLCARQECDGIRRRATGARRRRVDDIRAGKRELLVQQLVTGRKLTRMNANKKKT